VVRPPAPLGPHSRAHPRPRRGYGRPGPPKTCHDQSSGAPLLAGLPRLDPARSSATHRGPGRRDDGLRRAPRACSRSPGRGHPAHRVRRYTNWLPRCSWALFGRRTPRPALPHTSPQLPDELHYRRTWIDEPGHHWQLPRLPRRTRSRCGEPGRGARREPPPGRSRARALETGAVGGPRESSPAPGGGPPLRARRPRRRAPQASTARSPSTPARPTSVPARPHVLARGITLRAGEAARATCAGRARPTAVARFGARGARRSGRERGAAQELARVGAGRRAPGGRA
jgi:hypothetical protein